MYDTLGGVIGKFGWVWYS